MLVVSNAPGWPEVRRQFFNRDLFRESLEVIPEAFLLNIRIFVIAEAIILVFARHSWPGIRFANAYAAVRER